MDKYPITSDKFELMGALFELEDNQYIIHAENGLKALLYLNKGVLYYSDTDNRPIPNSIKDLLNQFAKISNLHVKDTYILVKPAIIQATITGNRLALDSSLNSAKKKIEILERRN